MKNKRVDSKKEYTRQTPKDTLPPSTAFKQLPKEDRKELDSNL
jgi:hypothetical protein